MAHKISCGLTERGERNMWDCRQAKWHVVRTSCRRRNDSSRGCSSNRQNTCSPCLRRHSFVPCVEGHHLAQRMHPSVGAACCYQHDGLGAAQALDVLM